MLGRKMFEDRPPAWMYAFRAILTAALVSIGWVFFRAATFADSRYVIAQMFNFAPHAPVFEVGRWLIWMAVGTLIVAIVEERWNIFDRLPSAPAIAYVAVMIVMMLVVELLGVIDKQIPFVYFQF